ncbi:aryl-sulfate sulfotransferase [bacterium]|nr:aryl-sulfate sulfotransferase [bacterium]
MKKTVLHLLLCINSVMISGKNLPGHVIYLHPRPDAADISYKTGIILRVDPAFQDLIDADACTFTVTGETSGAQSGKTVLSGNNVLFQLNNSYDPGERVDVSISCEALGWTAPFTYHFSVNKLTQYGYLYKPSAQSQMPASANATMGAMTTINGVTVPSDFPVIGTEILKEGTGQGKLFINNWIGVPYIMIFEYDGTPYYYERLTSMSRDFKIQANGDLSRNLTDGRFAVMDSSCNIKRYVQAAHGYLTDEHEFIIEPGGHYFLIAVGNRQVDMSAIVTGGDENAVVKDTHIQEFDEHGNIIFEWICFDYLNIVDAETIDKKASKIDYLHMNSLAVDYDGHIIASIRHLNEVIKINRQTGDIIWRLGGVHNQFDFVNDDDRISYQHDARPVPGHPDSYTVLDNGNTHHPQFSRAVEFRLDTEKMTATRVWEYRLPKGVATWMGNVQRLPNGNTHINWADRSLPKATEVTPDGTVVYQADFVSPSHSYRSFRFDWEHAAEKPYLIVENMPYHLNLIFNKFGDPTVREYQVFAAESGKSFTQLAVTSNTYYEAGQSDLKNNTGYSFRVRAVHDNGDVSPVSNTVTMPVIFADPDANLVENGDFSSRFRSWSWNVTGNARASRSIDSEDQFRFSITNGGSQYYDIQAVQNNISLVRGLTYVFEFDAYAESSRPFEAKLTKDGDPYTNYGKIGPTALTTRKKHFTFEFVMEDPSDIRARVVLNAGGHDADVTVDNVSLKVAGGAAAVQARQNRPGDFRLVQNRPNPFNPVTTIEYDVSGQAHVTITVFNLRGEQIQSLTGRDHAPGRYQVRFDGSRLDSGIYYYTMSAVTRQGRTVQKTAKMMLLK